MCGERGAGGRKQDSVLDWVLGVPDQGAGPLCNWLPAGRGVCLVPLKLKKKKDLVCSVNIYRAPTVCQTLWSVMKIQKLKELLGLVGVLHTYTVSVAIW